MDKAQFRSICRNIPLRIGMAKTNKLYFDNLTLQMITHPGCKIIRSISTMEVPTKSPWPPNVFHHHIFFRCCAANSRSTYQIR